MGKRCVAVLGLVAGVACDNGYQLAPTPCDDYCLALQRADCPEDWPSDCVELCELELSPTRFPDCAGEFDTLVGCYQALEDDDFECYEDTSEARVDRCEEEQFWLDACVEPVMSRCLRLCDLEVEHCGAPDDRYDCVYICSEGPAACEDEEIRYLDCRIASESVCELDSGFGVPCQAERDERSRCLADLRGVPD